MSEETIVYVECPECEGDGGYVCEDCASHIPCEYCDGYGEVEEVVLRPSPPPAQQAVIIITQGPSTAEEDHLDVTVKFVPDLKVGECGNLVLMTAIAVAAIQKAAKGLV